MGSASPVPITVRRRAIDLYHLLDRGKEEVALLQEEMKNVIQHFSNLHSTFSSSLSLTDGSSNPLSTEALGKNCFLKMKLLSVEGQLLECKNMFQEHLEEISLPTFLFDRENIPSKEEEDTEEVTESLLCLPAETVDEAMVSESESESDVDDVDSAFFSLSGVLS